MIFTGVDTDDLINYYCARYSIPDRQTQLNLNSGNLDAYILPYLYRHSDGYRFRLTERHMREIIKARWWVGAIGRLKAGSFARTAVYLRMISSQDWTPVAVLAWFQKALRDKDSNEFTLTKLEWWYPNTDSPTMAIREGSQRMQVKLGEAWMFWEVECAVEEKDPLEAIMDMDELTPEDHYMWDHLTM